MDLSCNKKYNHPERDRERETKRKVERDREERIKEGKKKSDNHSNSIIMHTISAI